jgi:MurNAc alpha-1-phosphate uridylyltransferase
MQPFPLMLFAAGKGTRMGALTATRPKPMIEVAGKPLIDHALDLAFLAGVAPVVANVHYLGDQIEAHLAGRGVAISRETDVLLETGGGLRQALPLLKSTPVMTLNSDAVWTGKNPLNQLADAWDKERMDALLLLGRVDDISGHSGAGDFLLDDQGRVRRANGQPGLVYLGAQIIQTDMLADVPQQVFSLNLVWDRMIAEGRAFGLIHQGGWCDVGRPDGIATAETMLGAVN